MGKGERDKKYYPASQDLLLTGLKGYWPLLEGIDRGMVLQEAGWGSSFTLGIDELYPGLEKLCLQPWASTGEVILSLHSALLKPPLGVLHPSIRTT